MAEEPFVPIENVAEHFSVSTSTVRGWLRQRLVPTLKIGGIYRFKISEVEVAIRAVYGEDPIPQDAIPQEVFNPDEDI